MKSSFWGNLYCKCLAVCNTLLYNAFIGRSQVMAKNATVSARIDEDVKDRAEDILRQLGIPVSVVINTLYHQIINKNGIPFTLTLPDKDKDKDKPQKGD